MTLRVRIQHQLPLAALAQQQPAFARLQGAQVRPQDNNRWQYGGRYHHHLQVVFLGKSGHGKSSLVNALTGQTVMATSDIQACTREAQGLMYRLSEGSQLALVDLPGLGESRERDAEYLPLYRQMLERTELVVYLLRADQRDLAIDLAAFASLFPDWHSRRRVMLVISACDKAEPVDRRAGLTPSLQQRQNIAARIQQLQSQFPGVRQIIPCSAATGWNLPLLSQAISQHLLDSGNLLF